MTNEPVKDADDHWQDGYDFGFGAAIVEARLMVNTELARHGSHSPQYDVCRRIIVVLRELGKKSKSLSE